MQHYPAWDRTTDMHLISVDLSDMSIVSIFHRILKDMRFNPVGKELALSNTEWVVIQHATNKDGYCARFFNETTTSGFIQSRSAAVLLEQVIQMGYQSLDIGAYDRVRKSLLWNEKLLNVEVVQTGPSPKEIEEFHLLSENEFKQAYMLHVDIRGQRNGKSELNKRSILEQGFNSTFPNIVSQTQFESRTNLSFELSVNQYIYFVPLSEIDSRKKHSLKIRDGWRPKPYEVIKLDDLSKPMYRYYLEAVENYFGGVELMDKVDLRLSLHTKDMMTNEESDEVKALERAMLTSDANPIIGALILNSGFSNRHLDLGTIKYSYPPKSNKFESWFKNSVFRNEDGSPQILYHGTAADFSVFSTEKGGGTGHATSRIGYWFSADPEIASKFAQFCVGSPSIMPVYLSIQNPKIYGPLSAEEQERRIEEIRQTQIVIDHDQKHLEALKVTLQNLDFSDIMQKSPIYQRLRADELETVERLQVSKLRVWELSATDSFHQMRCDLDEYTRYLNGMNNQRGAHAAHFAASSVDIAAFHEHLRSQGYDGIVIKETKVDAIDDHSLTTQIVAFEPNQIKSVTGNNGQYTDDPDIRFCFNDSKRDESSLRVMELDQLNAISMLASYFGTRVGLIRFNSMSGRIPDGAYFNRTLWLNVDSSMPLVSVFGHEFLHHLRSCRPDLYVKLSDTLTPLLEQRKLGELNSNYWDLNHDGKIEELIAQEFSIQFKEREFWNLLAKKDPSLFRDLAILIKDILAELKAIFSDTAHVEFCGDVSLAREAIADVVVEYSREKFEPPSVQSFEFTPQV